MNEKSPQRNAWARPDQQPQAPKRSPTDCMAPGCPLPGVFRINNEESICCVHDGEDPHRWPIQTKKINERFELFDIALRMTNAQAGSKPSSALIERLTGMGAAEPGTLTIRSYGSSIKLALVTECKGPRVVPKALQELRQTADSWQKIGV